MRLISRAILVVLTWLTLVYLGAVGLPSVSIEIGAGHREPAAEDYLNRRHIGLTQSSLTYDSISGENSDANDDHRAETARHRRRPVRQFSVEDVVRCFDELSMNRQRRPMHIAFIGDSTIRQHYTSFVQLFPKYDHVLKRPRDKPFDVHYHEDRNETFPLMDHLTISFRWRPSIEDDLIGDFKRWAATTGDDPLNANGDQRVPDIIFLGGILKSLVENSLTVYEQSLQRDLLPHIARSLSVHRHQEIIWCQQTRLLTGFNGPAGSKYPSKTKADEMVLYFNRRIRQIFRDTRVVIWDSVNAVVEEHVRACGLTRVQRHDRHEYFRCKDYVHPGFVSISTATQLIMNYMCAAL